MSVLNSDVGLPVQTTFIVRRVTNMKTRELGEK